MILDQQKRILGILQTFHHPNDESNESTILKGKVPVETIEALKGLEAELDTDPGLKCNLVNMIIMILSKYELKCTVCFDFRIFTESDLMIQYKQYIRQCAAVTT